MILARARLAATLLTLAAWGCGQSTQAGLVVVIDRASGVAQPEFLLVNVVRDGSRSVRDLRIPAAGVLINTANPIATVEITLDGDLTTPRDVQVSAFSNGARIAAAERLRVTPSATSAVSVQLTLVAFGAEPVAVTDGGFFDNGTTGTGVDAGKAPLDGPVAAFDASFVKLDAPTVLPDTAPAVPVNLVTNGSFESGASSWKTVNGNVASTASGPSGAFALHSDTAGAWCQQDIRGFVAGKTYVVRASGKGDAKGCTVGVVMGNDASGEVQRNTIPPFGTTWTTGMNDFVVPSAATWMFVFVHNNGSSTCWTDDVSITLN